MADPKPLGSKEPRSTSVDTALNMYNSSSPFAVADAFADSGISTDVDPFEISNYFLPDADIKVTGTSTPGLGETFKAGYESGAYGIQADLNYLQAAFNTITGNEQAFERNMGEAQVASEQAAFATKDLERFDEFLTEPTFKGFIGQVVKGTGQIAPSLMGAITGGFAGALAGVLGRIALNRGSKRAIAELVKDELKKGAPTKEGAELISKAYEAYKLNRNIAIGASAKRGAQVGALGFSYPVSAGTSFGEFDDAGVDLTATRAFQALAIGAPIAALDVAGQSAIAGIVGKLALRKAAKPGASLGYKRLAADIASSFGKAGLIEGSTEAAQESINIAQRFSVDDTYTMEQAKLRVAEAAFVGAFGGGAFGGAGGAAGSVFSQARQMISTKATAGINAEHSDLGVDNTVFGSPIPEPASDINAQIGAAFNPKAKEKTVAFLPLTGEEAYRSSNKRAIPLKYFNMAKANPTGQIEAKFNKNGAAVGFVGFVPEQGYVISSSAAAISDLQEKNTEGPDSSGNLPFETALDTYLGYTSPTPKDNSGTHVVQVRNKAGDIVFEQEVDESVQQDTEARINAERIAQQIGKGATAEVSTKQEALESRRTRADVVVKEMRDDEVGVSEQDYEGAEIDVESINNEDATIEAANNALAEYLTPEDTRSMEEEFNQSFDRPNTITYRLKVPLARINAADVDLTQLDVTERMNATFISLNPKAKKLLDGPAPKVLSEEYKKARAAKTVLQTLYSLGNIEQAIDFDNKRVRKGFEPPIPSKPISSFNELNKNIDGQVNSTMGSANGYSYEKYSARQFDPRENKEKIPDLIALFEGNDGFIGPKQPFVGPKLIPEIADYLSDAVIDQLITQKTAYPDLDIKIEFMETYQGTRLFITAIKDSINPETYVFNVGTKNKKNIVGKNELTRFYVDKITGLKKDTASNRGAIFSLGITKRDKRTGEVTVNIVQAPLSYIAELGRTLETKANEFLVEDSNSAGTSELALQKISIFAGLNALLEYKDFTGAPSIDIYYNAKKPKIRPTVKILPAKKIEEAEAKREGVDIRYKRGSDQHFGNPFSVFFKKGTNAVKTEAEAIVRYKRWLLGTEVVQGQVARRNWILEQIDSGRLDTGVLLDNIGSKQAAALRDFILFRKVGVTKKTNPNVKENILVPLSSMLSIVNNKVRPFSKKTNSLTGEEVTFGGWNQQIVEQVPSITGEIEGLKDGTGGITSFSTIMGFQLPAPIPGEKTNSLVLDIITLEDLTINNEKIVSETTEQETTEQGVYIEIDPILRSHLEAIENNYFAKATGNLNPEILEEEFPFEINQNSIELNELKGLIDILEYKLSVLSYGVDSLDVSGALIEPSTNSTTIEERIAAPGTYSIKQSIQAKLRERTAKTIHFTSPNIKNETSKIQTILASAKDDKGNLLSEKQKNSIVKDALTAHVSNSDIKLDSQYVRRIRSVFEKTDAVHDALNEEASRVGSATQPTTKLDNVFDQARQAKSKSTSSATAPTLPTTRQKLEEVRIPDDASPALRGRYLKRNKRVRLNNSLREKLVKFKEQKRLETLNNYEAFVNTFNPKKPEGKKPEGKKPGGKKVEAKSPLINFKKLLTAVNRVYKFKTMPKAYTASEIIQLIREDKLDSLFIEGTTARKKAEFKDVLDKQLTEMSRSSGPQTTRDKYDAPLQKRDLKGFVFTKIDNAYLKSSVIVTKYEVDNLASAQVILHEIGHIVIAEQMDKLFRPPDLTTYQPLQKNVFDGTFTPMGEQLYNEYVKDASLYGAQNKYNFEEWYSDQVAAALVKLGNEQISGPVVKSASPPTGTSFRVNNYFIRVANLLRNIFKQSQFIFAGTADFKGRKLAVDKKGNLLRKRARFDLNPKFKEYFEGVLEASRKNTAVAQAQKTLTISTKADIAVTVKQMSAIVPQSKRDDLKRAAINAFRNRGTFIKKFAEYAGAVTTFYRTLGPSGEVLANFWNKKSSTIGELGFNDVRVTYRNVFNNRLEDILGKPKTEWSSPEVIAILKEAENDLTPTNELSPKAQAVRKFFAKIFDDYITIPGSKKTYFRIGKIENYFSRQLNLAAIGENPQYFRTLIQRHIAKTESKAVNDPSVVKEAEKIVSNILQVAYGQEGIDIPSVLEDDIGTVSMSSASKRTLKDLSTKTIRDFEREFGVVDGILISPEFSVNQYIYNVVKKVEFEKRGGAKKLGTLVKDILDYNHPIPPATAPAEEIKKVIDARANLARKLNRSFDAQLGRNGLDVSDGLKTFNSIASVWTAITTLAFTVLSSFPDFAAIVMRGKEFNNFVDLVHDLRNGDLQEFKQLSRELGVVVVDGIGTTWMSPGELDWNQKWANTALDKWFKLTFLTQYTNFTRTIAVGMGKRFIINAATRATETDVRHLAEVGLTIDEVNQWIKDTETTGAPSYDTAAGKKVAEGIREFADQSIIRPNPGQRPNFANSPYFAIVFSLKSFFYSYGMTVLGGVGREIKNKYREDGNFQGGAMLLLLSAGFMLPLAALGLETREWLKYLGQAVLPGVEATDRVFMSDYMSTPEYMINIIDRAGALGPWTMVKSIFDGFHRGDNPFVSQIPFIDMIDQTIFEGNPYRALPFLNNLGIRSGG